MSCNELKQSVLRVFRCQEILITAVSKKTTYETTAESAGVVAFSEVGLSHMFVSELRVSKCVLKPLRDEGFHLRRQ